MAQVKLDYILKEVSLRIGDEVTTANANGELLSAADRLNAVNSARGKIYLDLLTQIEVDRFIELFPEWVMAEEVVLSPVKDPRIRKVFKLYNGSKIIEEIPKKLYFDAQFDIYSKWTTDTNNPRFIETSNKVEVLGVTLLQGKTLFLSQPVPAVINVADRTITAMTHSSGLITVTTSVNHLYSQGELVTISGVTSSFNPGVNGKTFIIHDVPSATTFRIALTITAGTYGSAGTVTRADIYESENFREDIIQLATQILLSDLQIV